MDERYFEGTLVLEKLARVGQVDAFMVAVDSEDLRTAAALMSSADIDDQTIAIVLKKIADADDEH